MELIVSHPSGAPVVRDYLSNEGAVRGFYGHHFREASAFVAKASEVDGRFDRAARERAAEAVITPDGADPARLERFVEQGGYMVTTGQQPGLYGGPLYSVHKALTAVRLAEALEARLDAPVLPLFWVASDDHDWAEANHTNLIGVDNTLQRFEVASPDPDRSPPLHRLRLGADASAELERFIQSLPDTEFSAPYIELIRDGFAPGRTLPEGFHSLLQALLGRFGLFFTDAAHPAVKKHSTGLLLSELERSQELEGVLRGTAEQLESDGYHLQVPIMKDGVNLFFEGPGGRERLYREGADFRLRTSGEVVSADRIRSAIEADPQVLSPNVLLRPVVESAVFPTLAYVGGPGEMAYFAQLRAYFDAHGVGMPVVYPRFGATIVETKIRKVLDKFGLEVEALNRPFHEFASDFARDEVPADVKAAIGTLRGAIGSGVGDLQKAAVAIDPTLKGPVQQLSSQAFGALQDVERKVMQATKRESEIALAQIEKAQVHLFPLGKPAERVRSVLYFLTRYGGALLDELYEGFAVNLD